VFLIHTCDHDDDDDGNDDIVDDDDDDDDVGYDNVDDVAVDDDDDAVCPQGDERRGRPLAGRRAQHPDAARLGV